MRIFTDILNGAELFNDSYKMTLDGGCMWKIESSLRVYDDDDDRYFDPSSEDGKDLIKKGKQQVIELIHKQELKEFPFKTKKMFKVYLKGYIDDLKGKLSAEDKKEFKSKGGKYAGGLLKNFKEYDFYTTDDYVNGQDTGKKDKDGKPIMVSKGMICMVKYSTDGLTPYVYFWSHGCKGENV